MIQLTLADVAAATGGALVAGDPATSVTGPVVVDSREVEPGALFVARAGEERDGHDFAAAAVEAGAVAVLAQRPVGVPAIVVDDSEQAFGRLARAVIDRLEQLTVVAVTGSSGKTTTKDLLAQVLEPLGPLVAPPGSYNTEVGVPLTVVRADESTRTLIVEMGARGPGHIAYLCDIAPPSIGVVLGVGSAHLGEFGDRDAIARAKAELVEALPAASDGGTAVLNADDQVVRRMAEKTSAAVLMVGESVHADVRAQDVRLDGTGRASFTLVAPDGSAPVNLRLVGRHQVGNALAVAGVSHVLGMPVADVAERLGQADARSRWRMEVTHRSDGVTVINDAYNANPESVRAALETLISIGKAGQSSAASPEKSGSRRSSAASPGASGSDQFPASPGASGSAGRTWAVLGEMRELGDSSAAEHHAVGRQAARLGVDRLLVVGEGARAAHDGAVEEADWPGKPIWVPHVDDAFALLRDELQPGDLVLVKSSRDAGLRHLGDRLVVAGQEDAR